MIRTQYSFCTLVALLGMFAATAGADDVIPSASQRFADPEVEETPDFQRHLVPLLGKVGCNGRACHGSFQGQGGFQLSLFGYDFDMDHQGLTDRIDVESAAASYALEKPTLTIPHEGGRRLEAGTWQYNLFLSWIEGGAANRPEDAADLVSLDVSPSEILFSAAGQTQPLSVTAVWSDGTQEDVTCLCRFQTNDGSIAEINEDGLITSGEPGDTYVVVFYDNGVTPVQVLRPHTDLLGDNYPAIEASTMIDRLVLDKLMKLGILPSDVCDDAEFIRRVSLDITGTLPSSDRVRAFLADESPDKRTQLVNELLETPAYAAWWATQLSDVTGNNPQTLNNVTPVNTRPAGDWFDWIKSRVAQNLPYDQLVEGIVLASSRMPGESYEEFCERESARYHEDGSGSYADSPGLTYYWSRNNFRTAEDRAVGFAYTFMGTRIQCAQCHKHPFDVWTQDDFTQFQQFFTRVNYQQNGSNRDVYNQMIADLGLEGKRGGELRRELARLLREGETVPFPELVITNPRGGRDNVTEARLLGGEIYNLNEIEDPRTLLMDWLRNDEQHRLARAFVNRTWATYFGQGIVNPTDDLSLANPPSNRALFDYLTQGFVDNGYDMKWLHREITSSDTYQRSWRPNETNLLDERNFSRAVPRRLPAEVAIDALTMATSSTERCDSFAADLSDRAIVNSDSRDRNGLGYALTVFGRSTRESNCDCDRSSEANLLQTVFTRNDNMLLTSIERRDGWVSEVSRAASGETETPNRPENYDEQVTRLERRLERARQSNNEEQIAEAERALNNYVERFAADEPEETEAVASDPASIIEEAYLRTLSRYPSEDEVQIAQTFLTESDSLEEGLEGLMWALVNTKEFLVNH